MKGRKTFGRKTADIRDKSRLEDITITQSGDVEILGLQERL